MNGTPRPVFGEVFWRPFLVRAATFAAKLSDQVDGFGEGDAIEEIAALLADFDSRLAPIIEIEPGGRIAFVVTAHGNRGAFQIARRLVRSAPALANWRFIALKPRIAVDMQQSIALPSGLATTLGDIRVAMVASRRGVEIALLLPIDAQDPLAAAICRPVARQIILELIGEEDMATSVTDVEVFPLSVLKSGSQTIALGDFVQEFDRLIESR
ncbi:MAG: hypothetical protein ABWZ27_03820 [Aestuariivirgaceae bacterium]|jgi:hypothetical protein